MDDTLKPQLLASPVLVVDDDPISRTFVEKALKEKGFSHIYMADSAVKAMAQMDHFQPDLVILDIFMKGLSGLDCCEWIRAQPKLRELPVLMLTSVTDEKMRFKAFDVGATDYVCKPLHPEELYARVKVHLESRLSLKNLRRYKERLDMELSSARELQSSILPLEAEIEDVQKRCKLQVAGHLNTSSEIGGDFWGMKSLFPHQTAFWMVDFSGHGVAAALNAFRLQAYLKEHTDVAARPGDYLSHLNDKLLYLLLRGSFATMFYGIVDTRGNRLHYACACSPHPLLVRKDGTVEKLDGSGTPLGICMQFYPTQSVEFQPGDTLVLYSDALTETPNADGKYISEEQLMTLLAERPVESAAQARAALLDHFAGHAAGALDDDLTLSVVHREAQ